MLKLGPFKVELGYGLCKGEKKKKNVDADPAGYLKQRCSFRSARGYSESKNTPRWFCGGLHVSCIICQTVASLFYVLVAL